ncbi:MAG: NUDIX hydrolase [Bacteroidota bacterium]
MPIKKWKTLSQRYLFKRTPWLTVREDTLEMPNGKVMESYYILEYPNWVNVIAITPDHQFVMVEQYRHGLQEISIELSAGVCDKDDPTPEHSARRELLEETGYGGGEWQHYMVNCANPGTHTNLVHCYLATDVTRVRDSQQLDEHEEIQVHLMSREKVLKLLEEDAIRQSLHAAALWKYMAQHPI